MKISCKILGHKWQWKWWVINEDDVFYCLRCGELKAVKK